MAPRLSTGEIIPRLPEGAPREAAVMILVFPLSTAGPAITRESQTRHASPEEELGFILTRRTETVEVHKGQISLPGGAQEPGEELAQTALREVSEELGIEPACVEILGEPLTPVHIPVSRFRATPFVGYLPARPDLRPQEREVMEIIEAPLETIVGERNIVEEEWTVRDTLRLVPFYAIGGHKVWGATAMVLSEFGEMLRRVAGNG
jgi:8-oxo-dGTP pyrophosphatase MutT (NUDIX family)